MTSASDPFVRTERRCRGSVYGSQASTTVALTELVAVEQPVDESAAAVTRTAQPVERSRLQDSATDHAIRLQCPVVVEVVCCCSNSEDWLEVGELLVAVPPIRFPVVECVYF